MKKLLFSILSILLTTTAINAQVPDGYKLACSFTLDEKIKLDKSYSISIRLATNKTLSVFVDSGEDQAVEYNIDAITFTPKTRDIKMYINDPLDIMHLEVSSLATIDISPLSNLIALSITKGTLSSLNLENQTSLLALNCNNNKLPELKLENQTMLATLECTSNKLTELKLENQTMLATLECTSNKLTELNLDKQTILSTLSCNNNKLTELKLENQTLLTSLHCSQNKLTELNLDKQTKLLALSCFNNQLASLNLENQTLLTSLDCSQNQLTELNLDKQTELPYLYYHYNYLVFSELPDRSKIKNNYEYTPQTEVEMKTACTTDEAIDLSHTGAETYVWYYVIGNTKVDSDDYTVTNGVTTFNKAVGEVYCQMKNSNFPDLTLRTTKIDIQAGQSIDEQQSSIKVEGLQRSIRITTDSPLAYNVRTLSGIAIAKGTTQGETSVSAPQGIYIVQVGDETHKVIVR